MKGDKKMKQFIEVGYTILYLDEEEIKLIMHLSKLNLLKFAPKKIEVYGFENKEE